MSRGFGKWQRWLLGAIKRHGKPMSFEQMRAAVLLEVGAPAGYRLNPSPDRALRRALHGIVKDGAIVALGVGGRAEPHRYFPSIMVLAMTSDDTFKYDDIIAGLDERDLSALSAAHQRSLLPR